MIRAILIGLLAGWLTGKLMRGDGYGFLADVILGLVGVALGAIVFGALGMHAYNAVGTLMVSTAGAIALVAFTRIMRGEI
jgi:uncharacterized membrane protein YeaQ/YmgE (transglycosylase-associated protein family)